MLLLDSLRDGLINATRGREVVRSKILYPSMSFELRRSRLGTRASLGARHTARHRACTSHGPVPPAPGLLYLRSPSTGRHVPAKAREVTRPAGLHVTETGTLRARPLPAKLELGCGCDGALVRIACKRVPGMLLAGYRWQEWHRGLGWPGREAKQIRVRGPNSCLSGSGVVVHPPGPIRAAR